jgi:hypothetical protein
VGAMRPCRPALLESALRQLRTSELITGTAACDPKATLIDISSAGGYCPSMTIALFAAGLYYAPRS